MYGFLLRFANPKNCSCLSISNFLGSKYTADRSLSSSSEYLQRHKTTGAIENIPHLSSIRRRIHSHCLRKESFCEENAINRAKFYEFFNVNLSLLNGIQLSRIHRERITESHITIDVKHSRIPSFQNLETL